MTRTRKLSRVKGLNQYDLKQIKETIPFYSSGAFNDSRTLSYFVSTSVNYPTMLPLTANGIFGELTTSLNAIGRTIFGAETQIFYVTNSGTNLPFDETKEAKLSGSYYLTGSELPGFQQPLRNKTRLDIVLPIAGVASLKSNLTDDSPFAYYNFTQQTLRNVGIISTSLDLFSGSLTISDYFLNKAIGFGPSIKNITATENKYNSNDVYSNLGLPITEFGFPSSNTYAANSSSYLELTSAITEPFLLEKIEVEIGKLELTVPNNLKIDADSVAISTFFILNQRNSELFVRPANYNYFQFFSPVSNFPNTPDSPYTNSSLDYYKTGNQIIDLVSFARIATVAYTSTIVQAVSGNVELYISNQSGSPTKDIYYSVTGSKLSLYPYQPTKNTNSLYTMFFMDNVLGTNRVFSQKLTTLNGTRSGVEDYSPRNLNKQIMGGQSTLASTIRNANGPDETMPVVYNTTAVNQTPYILFPEDKLIFGFQAPIFDRINLVSDNDLIAKSVNFWKDNAGSGITFSISKNIKITLYGSYLKMNEYSDYEEFHIYDNRAQLNTRSTVNIGEKK